MYKTYIFMEKLWAKLEQLNSNLKSREQGYFLDTGDISRTALELQVILYGAEFLLTINI
jgi:hypothetical protein